MGEVCNVAEGQHDLSYASATAADVRNSSGTAKAHSSSDAHNREGRSPNETPGRTTMFKIYCFFQDISSLRDQVASVWSSYEKGDIDLSVAYIATSVAIDLVISAEQALLRMKTVDALCRGCNNIWKALTVPLQYSTQSAMQSAETDSNRDAQHELLMTDSARILSQVLDAQQHLRETEWPIPIEVLEADSHEHNIQRQHFRRTHVLAWIIHDLLLLEDTSESPSPHHDGRLHKQLVISADKVSRTLQDVWETGTLNPSHAFAAEVLLYIRAILGPRRLDGPRAHAMQARSAVARLTKTDFDAAWHKAVQAKERTLAPTTLAPTPTSATDKPAQNEEDYLFDDFLARPECKAILGDIKQEAYDLMVKPLMHDVYKSDIYTLLLKENACHVSQRRWLRRKAGALSSYYLQRPDPNSFEVDATSCVQVYWPCIGSRRETVRCLNPVSDSYRRWQIQHELYHVSLTYASLRKSIFACAHLYNALQRYNLVEGSWPALDEVVNHHRDAIFAGVRSDNAETMYSRMAHRLNLNQARKGCSCHTMKLDLNETQVSLWDLLKNYRQPSKLLSRLQDVMIANSRLSLKTSDINMDNFITHLSRHLTEHIRMMNCDYITLTHQCSRMLKSVQDELGITTHLVAGPYHTSPQEGVDHKRVHAVEYILRDNRQAWMECSMKGQREFRGGPLLRKAAIIFNRELAKLPLNPPDILAQQPG